MTASVVEVMVRGAVQRLTGLESKLLKLFLLGSFQIKVIGNPGRIYKESRKVRTEFHKTREEFLTWNLRR